MTQDMLHDEIFTSALMEYIHTTGRTAITESNIWDVLFNELFSCGLDLNSVIYERLNANNRNYVSRLVTYVSSTLTLKNGIPEKCEVSESSYVATLHDLNVYLLSLGDEGKGLFLYVADLLSRVVLSQSDSGTYVPDKDPFKILMSDPDKLAELLGHVVLFIQENRLDIVYVEHLLADLSVSFLGANIDAGILGLFLGAAINAISDVVMNHLDDDIMQYIVDNLMAKISISASIFNLDVIQQIAAVCEKSVQYFRDYKDAGYDNYVTNDYRSSENFHMSGMTISENAFSQNGR